MLDKPTGKPTSAKLRELVEWQGYRCALTGLEITPENCQVDHIVPIKEGGTNEMENLQVVTATANRMKGVLSQDEFLETCFMVADYCREREGAGRFPLRA